MSVTYHDVTGSLEVLFNPEDWEPQDVVSRVNAMLEANLMNYDMSARQTKSGRVFIDFDRDEANAAFIPIVCEFLQDLVNVHGFKTYGSWQANYDGILDRYEPVYTEVEPNKWHAEIDGEDLSEFGQYPILWLRKFKAYYEKHKDDPYSELEKEA